MAPFLWSASFLLVLFGLLSGDNGQGLDRFISSTLPNVCPYTKFCSLQMHNQMVNFNRYAVPCCAYCSCETSCIYLGNCCPDVQHDDDSMYYTDGETAPGDDATAPGNDDMPPGDDATPPGDDDMPPGDDDTPPGDDATPPNHVNRRIPCVVPIFLTSWQNGIPLLLDGTQHGISFYRIVKECPPDAENTVDIQKCKTPDMNSVNDSIIVSDNAGRVFKNRHCAKCNGVHKYTTWYLKMICEDQFFLFDPLLHSEATYHKLMQYGCPIYSMPPTPEAGATSRCFVNVINSCNQTGQWVTYDENIDSACELITLHYIDGFARNKGFLPNIYKNPYCFLCNQNNFVLPTHVCMIDGMAEPTSHNELGLTTPTGPVTDLPPSDSKCLSDELFDHLHGYCRKLLCPPSKQPVDGKCQPTPDTTTAIQAKLNVHFTDGFITSLDSMSEDQFTSFSEAIYSGVRDTLDWPSSGCKECESQVIYELAADASQAPPNAPDASQNGPNTLPNEGNSQPNPPPNSPPNELPDGTNVFPNVPPGAHPNEPQDAHPNGPNVPPDALPNGPNVPPNAHPNGPFLPRSTSSPLTLILTIRPVPKMNCSMVDVLRVFQQIEEKPKPIRASSQGQSLEFLLYMSYEPIDNTSIWHEAFLHPPFPTEPCDNIKSLEAKFYCPSFEMNAKEFAPAPASMMIGQFGMVLVQNGNLRVCADDWFERAMLPPWLRGGGYCLRSFPLVIVVGVLLIYLTVAFV